MNQEAQKHQQVIFILSCFPSLLLPCLFLSSHAHVLIIHVATGMHIHVCRVKYKESQAACQGLMQTTTPAKRLGGPTKRSTGTRGTSFTGFRSEKRAPGTDHTLI